MTAIDIKEIEGYCYFDKNIYPEDQKKAEAQILWSEKHARNG